MYQSYPNQTTSAHSAFKVIFLGAAVSLVSCGKGHSGTENTPRDENVFPKIATVDAGITIAIYPFEAAAETNVYVHLTKEALGVSGLENSSIPGFHWKFNPPDATVFSLNTSDGEWTAYPDIASLSTASLDSDRSYQIKYKAMLSAESLLKSWPALTGAVGTTSGALMLPTLLHTLPRNLNVPVRLYFLDQNSRLSIVTQGRPCDKIESCVDFKSYAEALDTPFLISKEAKDISKSGDSQLSFSGIQVGAFEASSQMDGLLKEMSQKTKPIWNFLNATWGETEAAKSYQAHYIFSPVAGYQGLEHNNSTLIRFGIKGESPKQNFDLVSVTVHEMIHSWNVKHIFPKEHLPWNLSEYDPNRRRQLYFFEGMTEGFTRIIIPQYDTSENTRLQSLKKWNSSVVALGISDLKGGLEEISLSYPALAYQAGSFFTLHLAALAKNQFGEENAKEKLWSVMRNLAKITATDLSKPSWQPLMFAGNTAEAGANSSQGYSSEQLKKVLKDSLQLDKWDEIEKMYYTSPGIFSDKILLESALAQISKATNAELVTASNGKVTLSQGKPEALQWPF